MDFYFVIGAILDFFIEALSFAWFAAFLYFFAKFLYQYFVNNDENSLKTAVNLAVCFVVVSVIMMSPVYYWIAFIKSNFMNQFTRAIKPMKAAYATAVFPSVKANMAARLGVLYCAGGQLNNSVKFFDIARKKGAKLENMKKIFSPSSLLLLPSEVYSLVGKYDVAQKIANDAYNNDLIFYVFAIRGNYDRALPYITEIVEKDPSSLNYLYRAVVLKNLGANVVAYSDYKKALAKASSRDESNSVEEGFVNYDVFFRDRLEKKYETIVKKYSID